MHKPLLLNPEKVRDKLTSIYTRHHEKWLVEFETPVTVKIGRITELDVLQQPVVVRKWVQEWNSWQGAGTVEWSRRKWRKAGEQRIPERLILVSPSEVASWIGQLDRWETAAQRYQSFVKEWEGLAHALPTHFDFLADADGEEISRLTSVVSFFHSNQDSQLYPRQLPIPGIHSKWLEENASILVTIMRALLPNRMPNGNLYELCGLKQQPDRIRIRLLDSRLRSELGGLSDITVPITDLAKLDLSVKRAYIVENLQTGLSFNDLPDSIVISGLGYNVEVLNTIPWLVHLECFYWGDIDTHGFGILNSLRKYLPHAKSILMDQQTLLKNRNLWVKEASQLAADDLHRLSLEEQNTYWSLKKQKWGQGVRLEQERIEWSEAWKAIVEVVQCKDSKDVSKELVRQLQQISEKDAENRPLDLR